MQCFDWAFPRPKSDMLYEHSLVFVADCVNEIRNIYEIDRTMKNNALYFFYALGYTKQN